MWLDKNGLGSTHLLYNTKPEQGDVGGIYEMVRFRIVLKNILLATRLELSH